MIELKRSFASFRDPSGFVFNKNGSWYRQVNNHYKNQFEKAEQTGLFEVAIEHGWMLPFEDVDCVAPDPPNAYKVIRPRQIPFISYPYEWCFSQIKDAALLTLDLHLAALERGMLLKDASSYNIQFVDCKPVFIDHLSFDDIENHAAWPAYGQFCRHFLAPLLLMSYCDHRLVLMLRDFIDGIPLDLAAGLLPQKTLLRPGVLMHLHMHAKSQVRYSDKAVDIKQTKANPRALFALASSLRRLIEKIKWQSGGTEWADYYDDTNYGDQAMAAKKTAISEMLGIAAPQMVWDLGGNIGVFSRIAAAEGVNTLCFDVDPSAVERNYRQCRDQAEQKILPLVMDLTNPSPGLGFAGKERDSLSQRGPADLVMALALIHHLAISNNLPLDYIAEYLAGLGGWLIIEFVPKEDSQVQRLLRTREDIFDAYDQANFEKSFIEFFEIVEKRQIDQSRRCAYLMRAKSSQQ